jgi:hypothetical protein
MSNLNALCEVNLPWSGEPSLYCNDIENPKVFWGNFKTLQIDVASLNKIRVSEFTTPSIENLNPKPKSPHQEGEWSNVSVDYWPVAMIRTTWGEKEKLYGQS